MTKLSRLVRVDLRNIWETEAQDFTPWLAREENLAVLSDAIGIELKLEAQEKNVGPFRADILCRDVDSAEDESWVLIENQLERTDHNHLGQLITYAAGLNTVTVVWIAARFTEEHRASLDWLNEITESRFRFFGLEVELWRIADSPAAPKFNVISKPNDWTRSVSKAARKISEEGLNPTQQNYLDYWDALAEYLREHSKVIRPQKPLAQHWANFSIGRSGVTLHTLGAVRENWIAVELTMRDENAKPYFHLLYQDKEKIEQDLGFAVEWMELPERKASRIRLTNIKENPTDKSRWNFHFAWFKEKLEAFDRVFRPRIRELDAADWDGELTDA